MATTLLLLSFVLFVCGEDFPSALEIIPSGYWDGNDGPWSTFAIGVGSPPQPIRVIPAAAQTAVSVVLAEECLGQKFGFQNCSDARGGVFRYNESSTWHSNGVHNIEVMGYNRTFLFGTDTVGLGVQPQASRMNNQTVGGMKGSSSSFTGAMGISPNRYKDQQDEESLPTFFESLRSSTRIAGRSWAYTAGAVNRNVSGSLILGGYDAGRIVESKPKAPSFKMLNDSLRELSVGLQKISISEGSKFNASTQILKKPVTLPLEPLISRIWLPQVVCEEFEKALGLSWNASAQLYFITDEQHASFLARNISITFSLSDASLEGPTTDITLAYSDLALLAIYPLTDHPGRYFPVQRAYIDNQIVLGRAFLQATYVIADYDRMTMNISQANLDANSEKRIYTIVPPPPPPPPDPKEHPNTPNGTQHRKFASGVIAGIVIGCVLGTLALVVSSIKGLSVLRSNNQKPAPSAELDGKMEHVPNVELEGGGIGGKWEVNACPEPVELSAIPIYRELEGDMALVEADATERGTDGNVHRSTREDHTEN